MLILPIKTSRELNNRCTRLDSLFKAFNINIILTNKYLIIKIKKTLYLNKFLKYIRLIDQLNQLILKKQGSQDSVYIINLK